MWINKFQGGHCFSADVAKAQGVWWRTKTKVKLGWGVRSSSLSLFLLDLSIGSQLRLWNLSGRLVERYYHDEFSGSGFSLSSKEAVPFISSILNGRDCHAQDSAAYPMHDEGLQSVGEPGVTHQTFLM